MKVVHIARFINGGAGTAAYRIHKSILAQGIDSVFLSVDRSRVDGRVATHQIEAQDGRKNDFKENRIRRILSRLGVPSPSTKKHNLKEELAQMRNLIQCEVASLPFSEYDLLANQFVAEADIIHLHWVAGLLDYSSFFKQNKKPVVWTCHDMNPFLGLFHYKGDEIRNQPFTKKLNEEVIGIKKSAVKKNKAIFKPVCPSAWLQNEMLQSNAFSSMEPNIIFYPIDFDLYCPRNATTLRAELKIPDHHTVFLFVAETVHNFRKGFDLLLGALGELGRENVSLLIIGAAKKDGITGDNIHFIGSVNDDKSLSYYYSLADAIIIPSREDNLPNVMLEALACGTPVISFNVGGMMEVIIDKVNGLKVPSIDSNSLAEILSFFVKNKSIFNRKVIRQMAYESFEPNKIAQSYIQLYLSIQH